MKKKEVSYTPDSLPPLTEAQRQNLERLAAMPGDHINYVDIPKLTEEQLAEFKRPEHYRPVKKADHRSRGCGCTGMAQGWRKRLPVTHECHSEEGDA